MNKAIFITARLGSSRMPNKHLLKINGKYCIEHVINRAKYSKETNKIILCTTKNKEDTILCEIAKKNNIEYFRGSTKDKLDRWLKAAEKYNVDVFCTYDADDILASMKLIDMAFKQLEITNCDLTDWEVGEPIIVGSFTYCIKVDALRKVCEIKDTNDTEMMSQYFKDTNMFKVRALENIPNLYKRPDIRLTLDYPEDFALFVNIFRAIGHHEYMKMKNIIGIIDICDLNKINNFRNNDWKQNQIKNTKLVLKND